MNKLLFKNIDGAALIIFRISLGFLIVCESLLAIFHGWIKAILIEPKFTFNFIGFDWLQPLPGNGMYYYFGLIGLTGLGIMLGLRYRINIILFTILLSGVYFMQKEVYYNHYYLLLVISFIMIFLPANQEKSLDAKFGYVKKKNTIPQWIVILFISLIGIVYTYAAIAKFYPDWLDGTFTKILLQRITVRPYLLELFSQKWFYISFAYAGLLFDLFIVPLLLYKRTRNFALVISIFFHLFNSYTLRIGIFPYMALSFSVFFYESERIRQLFFKEKIEIDNNLNYFGKRLVHYFIIPLLIVQLLLPLRHYFIKGDVLWTEEGHRLSWRVMLRERTGKLNIKIVDNITKKESFYDYHKKLTYIQAKQLAVCPDLLWQYCQRIKKEYNEKDISIYIDCKNSINDKPAQILIDPSCDMAKAKWNYLWHNEWIVLH